MPRGRPRNPENDTPQEAIGFFLRWADRYGYDDAAIAALRTSSTPQHVRDVIQWAERQNFLNVAAHMRCALRSMCASDPVG